MYYCISSFALQSVHFPCKINKKTVNLYIIQVEKYNRNLKKLYNYLHLSKIKG